jgi:hypothetical protein
MDAIAFVKKWAASKGRERQTSHEHFIDLCRLLGEKTPNEADPTGDFYCFERGAVTPGGDGYADVWLRGHFAWEYKGKKKDLNAAYEQVLKYREALENPPLLVVSDIERYEIHTNWTNTESWIYEFRNADLADDEATVQVRTLVGTEPADAPELTAGEVLRALWEHPEKLRPHKTRHAITEDAANLFETLATVLRKWDVEDMRVARFITKLIFCMFATDVGLLPKGTFSEAVRIHRESGDAKAFRQYLARLFKVMNKGGKFAMHTVPYFDGRLFADDDVPEALSADEIHIIERLDGLNWADVEPAIFGTLFERIIDPSQRHSLGKFYTSRDDIELIVEPVLIEPLKNEWRAVQADVLKYVQECERKKISEETRRANIRKKIAAFHEKLATIRVLDPACGSGNFLYVSLALLKALEKEVIVYAGCTTLGWRGVCILASSTASRSTSTRTNWRRS